MKPFTEAEIGTFYAAQVPTLQRSGKEWRGPCPVHKGDRDSFAVNSQTGGAYCFSTCSKGWDMVGLHRAITGHTFKQALAEVNAIVGRQIMENGKPPTYQKVAEYPYTDKTGRMVFIIERRHLKNGRKDFKVRRPDGNGGWSWKKPAIADSLPYRLNLVAAAQTVYIVEGEKDVDTLESWGFVATTNAFGARKWKSGHAEHLRGKNVIILPDNDAVGRDHAEIVCQTLAGIAASVRVVDIPDLPESGDVTDWKENGHTPEQLQALVDATPPRREFNSTVEGARTFRVDESGLYVELIKDLRLQFLRIGPRLEVTVCTRNFEGEACGKQVRFQNWDGLERTCIIPLAALVGDGKDSLDQLLNLGYQPRRDRKSIEAVKDFIYQTNPGRFIRSVITIGWHSGFFVLPGRTIGPKGASDEVLFQPDTPTEHRYRSQGTSDSWREQVSRLCAGNSRLVFAISCAFAPPILDLLKADGGGIHFRGLSSTGKTTALLVAGQYGEVTPIMDSSIPGAPQRTDSRRAPRSITTR